MMNTSEIMNEHHIGETVWVCHYNIPDLHKKPLRNVPPTKCIVMSISANPPSKKVYYSSTYFAPVNKKGDPTKKVISPVDNTGYRSLSGAPLFVFSNESDCISEWNRQIADHKAMVEHEISTAADRWKNELSALIALEL